MTDMTDSTDNARGPELKPCPFCGAEAKLRGGPMAQETYSVWCVGKSRHHLDALGYDEEDAIAAWNARADLALTPQDDARVKALVEALRGLVPILCEGVEDGCGKLSRDDCAACEGYAALAAFDKGDIHE